MGFYEFRRQLEYKAKLKGNIINVIDRWFPSSKTCCNCGNVKKDLTLKERMYKCEKCGIELDRDFNASINIHNQLPIVHRKVTPVEITALDLGVSLLNLTSIVEAGNKHQKYLIMSRFE